MNLLSLNYNTLKSLNLEGNLDLENFLEKIYSMPSFKLSDLNLSKTYLSSEIIPRIFSSPQIIYLRSLALNCNPIVKNNFIEELKDSLQTKNLKNLQLRHLNFSNSDLINLCKGKWLGDIEKLDLRCNPDLKIENIIICEGNELQGLKAIRQLLMDNDFLTSLNRN